MDSSVSPKDEISFLRVCHHISNAVYCWYYMEYHITAINCRCCNLQETMKLIFLLRHQTFKYLQSGVYFYYPKNTTFKTLKKYSNIAQNSVLLSLRKAVS